MFCRICGTQIVDGAEFCHKCGTKVVKEADNAAAELNTNNMQTTDLFITYKTDGKLDPSMMRDRELAVFVDNIKIRSLTYGETAAYKITPGQHDITLGLMHIQIDVPEERNPVRLTVQSIAQEGEVIEQQLICEPSHLVIQDPQNNPGELAQYRNGKSPEQYQVTKSEVIVCHRCGIKLDKKADFCHECGAKIRYWEHESRPLNSETVEKSSQSTSVEIQPRYKLECPNCYSSDLIPISETITSVSGGGYRVGQGCCGWILLGPLGLLCGLCGTGVESQSKTVTSWVCKDCGNKFRNPRDIKAEEYSEGVNICFTLLMGAGIIYIAGNLLNDYNLEFFGPNKLYIRLGAIGIILGAMGALGLGIGKIEDDTEYMGETDKKVYYRKLFTGTIGFFIIFLAAFIGGILSAGSGTRFLWVPAWIYILVGVMGMIVSAVAMIIFWRTGLDDEKAEKFDEKVEALFEKVEKVVRKIKKK